MTGMEVGDTVAFNDGWFLRRRMPVPPIGQRNRFTVRFAGTDRVLVDVPDKDGRRWWQLVPTDWLVKLTKEESNEGADAASSSP